MRTANPVLSDSAFSSPEKGMSFASSEVMTIDGTINKCLILAIALLCTAAYSWSAVQKSPESITLFMLVGGIGGFIVAIVTTFKKEWSPVTAPLYAALEGLLLGAFSLMFEKSYPGIAVQALLATFCTFAGLLFCYKAKLIEVTEKFRSIIILLTFGIAGVYLISFALSFFGINIPYIHESGMIGIAFSVGVSIVAALNLLLDFDFIDRASSSGSSPKYMEWYGSFALMVTLIWLYIEIIKLLAKLRRR